MTLGIKLIVDKGSAKAASKELGKGTKKGVSQGINSGTGAIAGAIAGEEAAGGKKKGKGAFGGAALGGLIGALLGTLEPIKEILGVIGGILKIALVPVMMLMKPFLILFLKLGMVLLKMFTGGGLEEQGAALATGRGLQADTIEGSAGEFVQGFKDKFFGWIDEMFNFQTSSLFLASMGAFLKVFITGLGNIFFGFLDILGGVWDVIVGIFTGDLDRIVQGIVKIFTGIFDIFLGVLKTIVGAAGMVGTIIGNILVGLWNGLKALIGLGAKLFNMIVDTVKSGLSVLAGIGKAIKDAALGFIKGIGGGIKRIFGVNDALITSGGDVVKFHPDDNIMAFKDFSTLAAAGSGQGSGKGDIYITVEGFVGSEEELADRMGRALNSSSRGGTSNF